LTNVLESLVSDDVQRKERGAKAKAYVAERSGATLQVVSYLAENELV
jgi:hypothetical protein